MTTTSLPTWDELYSRWVRLEHERMIAEEVKASRNLDRDCTQYEGMEDDEEEVQARVGDEGLQPPAVQ